MKYVSAKWVGDPENPAIEAVGEDGLKYYPGRLESTVPPWPEYLAEGGTIDPADPIVEPVPDTISDRQFAQQLAKLGLITEAQALAWVSSGVIPEPFEIYIDSLPTEQQFDAKMLLSGATQFDRHHSFTVQFGAARDMTPEQIDQLWRDAAQL